MNRRIIPIVSLILLGSVWGLTMPLTKIAVGHGGNAFGLVVWETSIAVIVLSLLMAVRRQKPSFQRKHLKMYLFIAVVGNLIPTTMWFFNAAHLPAGILAIVISLVPMFALPIAILMRLEKFQWLRFAGILCGAVAILALLGPQTSLPDPAKAGFVLLAMIGPICYGIEGNVVAKFGFGGLGPVQILLGASLISLAISLPAALYFDQWFTLIKPWGAPEIALVISSVLTTFGYAGYLWLVGRAGSVFAAQVSYLVTVFGVFWSIILLSERYSGWVWLSLALMLVALFLVRPKDKEPLEAAASMGETGP